MKQTAIRWLLFTIVFVALAAGSWRRWPDALIDFGAQLYVPWRISEGAGLYTDIAWLWGPLSQYVNAALFSVFGVSYTVLIASNLALVFALLWLLVHLFARIFGDFAATVCGALFLVMFAFAQYLPLGNYNCVSPYSHGMTHGLLLTVAMLLCCWHLFESGKLRWGAMAGACFGLLFLTRVEVFVAASAAMAVIGAWVLADRETSARLKVSRAMWFGGGAAAPIVISFLLFALSRGPGDAIRAVGGAWAPLLASNVSRGTYFQALMGTDRLGENLGVTFLAFLYGSVLIAGILKLCRWQKSSPANHWLAAIGVGALALAVLLADWQLLFRGLPLFVLAMGTWIAVTTLRGGSPGSTERHRLWLQTAFGVFALSMLGKILFLVIVRHYGIFLAMPATLFVVGAVLGPLGRTLLSRPFESWTFRCGVVTAVGVLAVQGVELSHRFYGAKTLPVTSGADLVYGYPPDFGFERDSIVREFIDWGRENIPADSTMTVLPDGIVLNYALRLRNPSRFINFMITEMDTFGEAAMVDDLEEHAPDFVALVEKDTSEFGVGYFGRDPRYGQGLRRWIEANYRIIRQFGAQPFADGRFGILLLRRRT